MGGRGTWLVGIAVAVIAVAAIVDAVRGGGGAQPTAATEPIATTSTSTESGAAARPVVDGPPGGVLYYTDEDCMLRGARLPTLLGVGAPSWHGCRFVLSPDATSVSAPPSSWDPTGDFLFRIDKGWIVVTSGHEPYGPRVAGTAAAWRPDGTLTYVADGAVREWPSGRILLSQDDFAAAVRAHPSVPDHGHVLPVTVRELAWLDNRHPVVIIEGAISGPRQTLLAIYEGHRLVSMHFEGGLWLSQLRVSPRGGFIGLRAGDAFLLLNRRGDTVPAPLLTGYMAIAWSGDDRWMAAATGRETVFFRTGETSIERRLPLVARDLTWRASSGSTLAQDSEALAGVASLGATGRLLVTLPDSGGCVLSALELPSLEWAEHPPGNPNPCRFTLDENDEVLSESAVPQPGGSRVAGCVDRAVDVLNDEGFVVEYPMACAPAWMPDGQLTFIRNGGLFEPKRRLLSRGDVSRLIGRPSKLEEVAWVDDDRFWAVVRSGSRATVALMTIDGTLAAAPSFDARVIEGLRVSTTGTVAARTERGVVFLDGRGRRVLTVPKGWAVAWEPRGDIAAVATPTEVLLVLPSLRQVATLPIGARDLEWAEP